MTAADIALLRAEIALLRSLSPTKGPAPRYGDDDWRRALAKVSHRLTWAAYLRTSR